MAAGTHLVHDKFSAALLEAISSSADVNVVCSPWSVGSVLAILAGGVDSEARDELTEALSGGIAVDDVPGHLEKDAGLVGQPRSPQDRSILAVANTVWVEENRTPRPAFVEGLKAWPGAAIGSVPIIRNPEEARHTINDDISVTTKGLIPEILPQGSLTSDVRAVLTNAIYLLAGWLEPFFADQTESERFGAPGGTRRVPTMRARREAGYASRDGWAYLSLPLWLSLNAEIMLPPEGQPSPGLQPEGLDELRNQASTHHVDLHFPRFRVSSRTNLIPPLRSLGIRRIFEPTQCAVSGVIMNETLFISKAVHQAVLRVDEKGVEGTAATALTARVVSRRMLPEAEMRVDRPFFFLVTDDHTGCVLFSAHVAEPEPEQDSVGVRSPLSA